MRSRVITSADKARLAPNITGFICAFIRYPPSFKERARNQIPTAISV